MGEGQGKGEGDGRLVGGGGSRSPLRAGRPHCGAGVYTYCRIQQARSSPWRYGSTGKQYRLGPASHGRAAQTATSSRPRPGSCLRRRPRPRRRHPPADARARPQTPATDPPCPPPPARPQPRSRLIPHTLRRAAAGSRRLVPPVPPPQPPFPVERGTVSRGRQRRRVRRVLRCGVWWGRHRAGGRSWLMTGGPVRRHRAAPGRTVRTSIASCPRRCGAGRFVAAVGCGGGVVGGVGPAGWDTAPARPAHGGGAAPVGGGPQPNATPPK